MLLNDYLEKILAKSDPYPMRLDSFLTEVHGWPDAYSGKYIKLISYYYCNGKIPAVIMEKVPEIVREKFTKDKDGSYYHSRVKATMKRLKDNKLDPLEQGLLDSIFQHSRAVIGKKIADSKKGRSAFKRRIDEGFTIIDYRAALDAIAVDDYHNETSFKYVTLEYLSREDQLSKWVSASCEVKKKSSSTSPASRTL